MTMWNKTIKKANKDTRKITEYQVIETLGKAKVIKKVHRENLINLTLEEILYLASFLEAFKNVMDMTAPKDEVEVSEGYRLNQSIKLKINKFIERINEV